jgi:hypothetical protein
MKNIHILPTDKPSKKGDIVVWNGLKIWNGIGEPPHHNQNIYITNDEEIKDCYYLVANSVQHTSKAHPSIWNNKPEKIILTTDPDLIKDGVQDIDDTFLEWFVKNSSCESVEVKNYKSSEYPLNYKIIIPQEKPKKSFGEIWSTLTEEQSEYLKGYIDKQVENAKKWQSKRMYSEEEVLKLLKEFHFVDENYKTWFEKNKKQIK